MHINYIDRFLNDRNRLIGQGEYSKTWGGIRKSSKNESIIEIPSPQLLAAFAGYLTGYLRKEGKGKVFFRGENTWHDTTIPSLFRSQKPLSQNDIFTRKAALDKLVENLSNIYEASRFQREFGPILQHYGICTHWVDLVDNIFVALWFSKYRSNEESTYVKFFAQEGLIVKRLSEEYQSLSLRPHCQYGLSATREGELTPENIDLNSNLIAIAKIPKINEKLFSETLMFPNEELDSTYKLLLSPKFDKNLNQIASDYSLDPKIFGVIDTKYKKKKS